MLIFTVQHEKFIFIYIVLITHTLLAQEKEEYEQVRYVNIGMENDLFQLKNQSDKFFSAGFFYELAHPVFDHKVSRFALLGLKDAPVNQFGIRINHLGFTPSEIDLPEIDTTDRPYAGMLFTNFYRVNSDYKRGIQLVSLIRLGIMGPASGMEWVQKPFMMPREVPLHWAGKLKSEMPWFLTIM